MKTNVIWYAKKQRYIYCEIFVGDDFAKVVRGLPEYFNRFQITMQKGVRATTNGAQGGVVLKVKDVLSSASKSDFLESDEVFVTGVVYEAGLEVMAVLSDKEGESKKLAKAIEHFVVSLQRGCKPSLTIV